MPFISESQRRLCWVMYNKDKKQGKTPSWDCHKWEKEGKGKKLPWKTKSLTGSKSPTRKSPKKSKIHIGPKGGRYIIKNKKKVYLK